MTDSSAARQWTEVNAGSGPVGPLMSAVEPKGPPAPSFRALFEENAGYMLHTLRRLGVPERDLEDVAHEAFLVAHRRLSSFDTTRALRPWLFGIAYRTASDYRRLSRNRWEKLGGRDSDPPDPPDQSPSTEHRLMDEDARALLLRALDALSFEQRAIVILHEIDGIPIPDAAEILGVPVNTAYSRLRLGRAELRAAALRERAILERGGRDGA